MAGVRERIPVLVVDDELAMRRLANEWLKHYGFDVIEAESSYQAELALRTIPNLRLVVTDFQLKVGNARLLHQGVRDLLAKRRGLFCILSGAELTDETLIDPYNQPYADYFREYGVTIFRKPVSWGEIISYLQAWLDAG